MEDLTSKESQQALRKLLNKEWRMHHLYSIVDKNKNRIQFVPNLAQEDFNKNKHTRNIILKSRQLGFTTFESIDMLDDVLFTPNFEAVLVSYDIESATEIFDNKISFAWDNIPEQVRDLYTVDQDTTRRLKFGFGDNSYSSISVKTSARSGTKQRIHISEFGKICEKYPDKAKEIISGTIPSVPLNGRVDIESTAEGQEGYFYDMFVQAINKKPESNTDYKAHFYNWTWDKEEIGKVKEPIPNLPTEFLDIQKTHVLSDIEISYYYLKWLSLGRNMSLLKQEYPTTWQEAFETSLEGTYYANQIELAKNEGRMTDDVLYDEKLLVHTFWDIGNDQTSIWFAQTRGNEIRLIDYMSSEGESMQYYLKKIKELPYNYGTFYGPHDLAVKEYTANRISRLEVALSLGFKFVIVPNISIDDGINAVRTVFNRCYFNSTKCEKGIKALSHYRKEWDDANGHWRSEPRHDINSHGADAFRYLAVGLNPRLNDRTKVMKRIVPLNYLTNY